MAKIRRLTLEEWFLDHQLRNIKAERFHIAFHLEVEITAIEDAWSQEDRLPLTAVVIKAVGLWCAQHPCLNRVLFRGLWGDRVVEFDRVNVNVPVMLRRDGIEQLSATIIQDADQKSLSDIRAELKEAINRDPMSLPVGRYVWGRSNTWWNRLRLRVIHWVVNRFPGFYVRAGGGGVGVSSLLHNREEGVVCMAAARGATAICVIPTSTRKDDLGRLFLQLGVTMEHSILAGDALTATFGTLRDILQRPGEHGLGPESGGRHLMNERGQTELG